MANKTGAAVLGPDPGELAEGWRQVRLRDVVEVRKEKVEPDEVPSDTTYLSLEHIESETGAIVGSGQASDVRSTKNRYVPGDVLYGRLRPYLNKVAMPQSAGICSTDVLVLMPGEDIRAEYLRCVLGHPELLAFTEHASTGDLPRIKWDQLGEVRFPLPPDPVQKELLEALDELMGRAELSGGHLERASVGARGLRRAVLDAACSGELTGIWREANSPELDARQRVDKMRGEAKASFEEAVKAAKASGARKPKRFPSLATSADPVSVDGVLPDRWEWYPAGVFYRDARYGTSTKASSTRESDTLPVIRIPNIGSGRLTLDSMKYVEANDREADELVVRPGDLLVCRTNGSVELIGKTALVGELDEPHVFASYLIRLRLETAAVLPEYFHIFLNSRFARRIIVKEARSSAGQFNLNLEILSGLPFPLPPLEEQEEIIRQAPAFNNLADALGERIGVASSALTYVRRGLYGRVVSGEPLSAGPPEAGS